MKARLNVTCMSTEGPLIRGSGRDTGIPTRRLRQIEKSVEQNKVDERWGAANINITRIHLHHPRLLLRDKQHDKVVAGIAAGGMALGLGLAFLLGRCTVDRLLNMLSVAIS